MSSHILSFDHGTTELKVCIFNLEGKLVASSRSPIPQIFPRPGWVEQDPKVLWELTLPTADQALKEADLSWSDILTIGLTNQRETTIIWDSVSGKPVHNAIVWQCRRTSQTCDKLRTEANNRLVHRKTGLIIDPYFSATKIRWILDHVYDLPPIHQLHFGTVDSWIIWNLTGRQDHVTDTTNASRTLLFDIHKKEWDNELNQLFDVPIDILPVVCPSDVGLGFTDSAVTNGHKIPISADIGDQQASLFGQKCWEAGTAKSTYGTGAFIVMNLGDRSIDSPEGLLTTLACDSKTEACYALEGSIFTAGATLEWLEKGLGLINDPSEVGPLAESIPDNGGVYLVPAFIGLGAPHWNAEVRGNIQGLSQATGKAHIARAALEAMAYQTREVIQIMQRDAGLELHELRVDGGVTRSSFLMQFLADILGVRVTRTDDPNITAKGAAFLAGLNAGVWPSSAEVAALEEKTETFYPEMGEDKREELFEGWMHAINKTLSTR